MVIEWVKRLFPIVPKECNVFGYIQLFAEAAMFGHFGVGTHTPKNTPNARCQPVGTAGS
jgi:spore maturation protein SpmA